MRKLIGLMLLAAATQIHAQPLEGDLDGNASALQASEMKPARQPARVASQPKAAKAKRQRVAAR